MKKIFLLFIAFATIASSTASLPAHAAKNQSWDQKAYDRSGEIYRNDLLKVIQDADEITVAEHSNLYDYWVTGGKPPDDYQEKVYTLVKLSQDEKLALIESIRVLDPRMPKLLANCIIEPHHRIAFYIQGKLVSTMEVCFRCGQIAWDRNHDVPPSAMFGVMRKFISSIGLHPEAEWRAKYNDATPVVQEKS